MGINSFYDWVLLQLGHCLFLWRVSMFSMRVFDFHHIYKPDHWEWGSKSPNWWGSQAEFAQMTWVKNRASINHTAKLCHLVPGPKTYGRILISSVEKITTKYSCHWTLVYILRSIYFLQSVIYYVFVGYLAALLVYPFVEVFEAVHLVARKSCSDATMLAESTCESLNNTVLPVTLEAKGTEACYFQLRQDFRLTKILSLCKLKTCQVCLGLVKLQFYKSKTQPNTWSLSAHSCVKRSSCMNIYLVARKSCSDAAMTFWKEANINRLNLNQSNWTDRLPMMCSWLIVRGGRKYLSNSECFGAFWRACSTVVNWKTAYLDW